MTFQQIIGDLKKKIYAPVYFLHGDEPFFIDAVVEHIENNVLNEADRAFNQTVLYGKDVDVVTLISYAKRYPMMASHQVVIIKEAQDVRNLLPKDKDRDPFLEYLEKPTPSTILVLAFKHKTVDKRTRLYKAIDKYAVVLESKKLYDRDVPGWITQYFLSKGGRIHPKAAMMMGEHLGNDLAKIANEADKLMISQKEGVEITSSMIEERIGISKDFNMFELYTALATRNIYKANLIAKHFGASPKNNPIQLTIPSIYSFFNKVIGVHAAPRKDRNELAAQIGVSPYFVNEYLQAAQSYSLDTCMRNVGYIREYDLKSKGVNAERMEDGAILKELVYKLLH
ncbi:MAG: DNA polymerase III subunit delta [Bacteroidota bacterium]